MTKDVLVKISGLHAMDTDNDELEIITAGDYFLKNGKHYVIYEEALDGFDGNVRNTVKISENMMEIRKQGMAMAHMVFEKDKKSITRYATPMGEMIIEVTTNEIEMKEEADRLKVCVDYALDINYEHVSDCKIIMDICSRAKADLNLSETAG
ncbi:MAG: DUF1934 domain-containing protein [Brotaphodocola sp.]